MGEDWRIKRYYEPRVLIETQDVLSSPFPSALLCLDGSELNIVRNLLAYAHRRSTFVSEYRADTYLAPTEAEWDDLQAVVAELESKMSGCQDIYQVFLDMLAQLECICEGTGLTHSSPIVTNIYHYYATSGDVQWEDDYNDGEVSGDPVRCATAQLTYQYVWEILTEVVQPFQTALHDALLPAVIGVISLGLGGIPALIPGAAVYSAINVVADALVESGLAGVRTAIEGAKFDLVCAVYDALEAGTFGDAAFATHPIIDGLPGLYAIDKVVLKALFSAMTINAAAVAWEEQTPWALNHVVPGYCDTCAGSGLYWSPDQDCWYNTGAGWVFYEQATTPVTEVPMLLGQEIAWQPNVNDNLTLTLHNAADEREGVGTWLCKLYGVPLFGLFYTGSNLTTVTHPREYFDVSMGPWDWDQLNRVNMDGNASFAYVVQPTWYCSFEVLSIP